MNYVYSVKKKNRGKFRQWLLKFIEHFRDKPYLTEVGHTIQQSGKLRITRKENDFFLNLINLDPGMHRVERGKD